MKRKNSEDVTKQSLELLLDTTLNRHGVKLNNLKKLGRKEKQELKSLINNLKDSVEALSRTHKE